MRTLDPRFRLTVALALVGTLSLGCDDGGSEPPADTMATTADVDATDTVDTPDGITAGAFVVNEVSAGSTPDWVELYNGTAAAIALDGWAITDDLGDPMRFTALPAGQSVAAGGYVIIELQDMPGFPGWTIGGDEEIGLVDPAGQVHDFADWSEGDSPDGGSWGRIVNGEGPFKTLLTPTPGAANVDNPGGGVCGDGAVDDGEGCDDGNRDGGDGCAPACSVEDGWTCDGAPSTCGAAACGDGFIAGDEQCDPPLPSPSVPCTATCQFDVQPDSAIIINEAIWNDPDFEDWIEIVNVSDTAIDLGGYTITDDAPDDNGFVIPPGVMIGAGEYLVFERDSVNPDVRLDFGLGSDDAVLLFGPSGGLADLADWQEGEVAEGESFARVPDRTGDFQAASPTRGTPNM